MHILTRYMLQDKNTYYGALVGRVANRIAQGKFSIGADSYSLSTNHAPNALHGGPKGFDKVRWTATANSKTSVTLSRVSPDGEEVCL